MYRGLKKLEISGQCAGASTTGAPSTCQRSSTSSCGRARRTSLFAVTPEIKYYVIGREPEPVFAGLYLGSLGKKALVLSMEAPTWCLGLG